MCNIISLFKRCQLFCRKGAYCRLRSVLLPFALFHGTLINNRFQIKIIAVLLINVYLVLPNNFLIKIT